MKKNTLFALWGGLFILCAGLGFITEPTGILKALMVALAVGCFIPAGLLVRQARQKKDRATLALIRNLSALSLILTLALLVANFLSVLSSEALGTALYYILIIVSSPMVCGQYWALSLFLWACVMIASWTELKKT